MRIESMAYHAVIASPVGPLGLAEHDAQLILLEFLPPSAPLLATTSPLLVEAARQLACYFQNPLFVLDLPFMLSVSAHQHKVLAEIATIPVGNVQTYGEISKRIQSSPRSVGGACGRNPLPLFIPCHRVVAAKGLGGFNAGRNGVDWLPIKRWLLNHEQARHG
ncbi:methylated-DNA--[protein]-cysteine S-methyltransferase [Iodobacter fluviatilis]|jgi:methylated-DNA-[protein]-cysteine S-methyltransferase|uniref:Cysteine methyltransferase n=1 Tax=Iodobacter fluviatilis TaxID=537 RepID=A0A7G3G7V0_9NEIS|nr:methylated-DNA--[protein]-cysteine S-methyltransferase [Iodobacter fluviatilis]QBC43219.1 cysteine methyltransferase [Iodobacter fluviatilis]